MVVFMTQFSRHDVLCGTELWNVLVVVLVKAVLVLTFVSFLILQRCLRFTTGSIIHWVSLMGCSVRSSSQNVFFLHMHSFRRGACDRHYLLWFLKFTCTYLNYTVNNHAMLCVPAAQSHSSPDWEKKVVEYFKEKLKLNDAHTWVS